MNLLKEIKRNVEEFPNQKVFIWKDKSITYKDLWDKSDRLANYFVENTITAQSPIIVYGHMCPEMIVSFLAAVKAGHPYIPVDISIPHDRVLKIINNSQAELFINLEGDLSIEGNSIAVINKPDIDTLPITNMLSLEKLWVENDDNFYIIYTSGSTGDPKGVQISHRNLSSFTSWLLKDFNIEKNQVFLNQAPFSFDLSVMDLYPALISGGTIYAIDKDMIARPKILFEALKSSNTNIWTSTPSFVQICLMDPSFNSSMLPNLTTFLFCGEVLPINVAKELKNKFPNASIYNTYGPTEATVAVTSIEVTNELLNQYEVLPVGYPKQDCEILIMSQDGGLLEDGEKGEIVIIGPNVSKGYLANKKLTNESFFFYNGRPAYKTGDAGYLKEGLLFYNGRLDFQVKLRGYRIELEEIEFYIQKSIYVKKAIVTPIVKNGAIQYLTAFIIPEKHNFVKDIHLTREIKKEIGKFLPAYMIPRVFKYCETIPVTSNGKVDRKKLMYEAVL